MYQSNTKTRRARYVYLHWTRATNTWTQHHTKLLGLAWPPALRCANQSDVFLLYSTPIDRARSHGQWSYLVRAQLILDCKSQFQSTFSSPLNNIDVCMTVTVRNAHQVMRVGGASLMLGSINELAKVDPTEPSFAGRAHHNRRFYVWLVASSI